MVAQGQATVIQNTTALLVFRTESTATIPAGSAITIQAGDVIQVSADSAAQLHLFDGSRVDLLPGSRLQVSRLEESPTYWIRLDLVAGGVVARVIHLLGANDGFEIATPSSTASVRGTIFTVLVIDQVTSYISCDEGMVAVTVGGQEVEIRSGEEVTAVLGQPLLVAPQSSGSAPTPTPPEPSPRGDSSTQVIPSAPGSAEPASVTTTTSPPTSTVPGARTPVASPFSSSTATTDSGTPRSQNQSPSNPPTQNRPPSPVLTSGAPTQAPTVPPTQVPTPIPVLPTDTPAPPTDAPVPTSPPPTEPTDSCPGNSCGPLPTQSNACNGPAGAHNPHCQPTPTP